MALSFTENEDFRPVRVELIHEDSGDIMYIEQDGSTKTRKGADYESSPKYTDDNTVYIKD